MFILYLFSVEMFVGVLVLFDVYCGKVLLIVNIVSECGFML